MNILSTRGVLEQGACLDALIAIMLDSSSNQMVMFYFFIEINKFSVGKDFALNIIHASKIS